MPPKKSAKKAAAPCGQDSDPTIALRQKEAIAAANQVSAKVEIYGLGLDNVCTLPYNQIVGLLCCILCTFQDLCFLSSVQPCR